MKKLKVMVLGISLFIGSALQAGTVLESSWSDVIRGRCSDQNTAWWSSAEAIRIAENVLLYQKDIGGWPKNINMQLVLSEDEKNKLIAAKPGNGECTIDNGAVTYELTYLSKVHKVVGDATVKSNIKNGFIKGIEYLLEAQYDNGGWPQFYPLKGGYANHITYNDDAMLNVMEILRHVYSNDGEYSISVDTDLKNKAKESFDKGFQCLLNTQYNQNGKLTVWCAQHHYATLEPALARSYELPSLSGYESENIINMLMSVSNPTKEVQRAIHSAVDWYAKAVIKGQRLESFTNSDGLSDKRIVFDNSASDMWARFYTLESSTPFFCDRDGIKKYSIAEIGHERRNGYSWYVGSGTDVANAYKTWLPKWGKNTIMLSPIPDASFINNQTVPVFAKANKYTGKTFQKFELTIDNDTYIYSGYEIDTSFNGLELGEHTIIIKSYYDGYTESDTSKINITMPIHNLSVRKGTGSGDYEEGSVVAIEAEEAPSGKFFYMWTGDTSFVENTYDSVTTVTISDSDVSILAKYTDDPSLSIESDFINNETIISYPNPFVDNLTLDLSKTGAGLVEIYDINGRKVYSELKEKGIHILETEQLSKGIYSIRIINIENKVFSAKILKY